MSTRDDVDFETFFQRSYPPVYRGVFAMCGNREAAEEATQEAFARAYSRWSRLRNQSWIEGWVMTTALNQAKRMNRRRGFRAIGGASTPDALGLGIAVDPAAALDEREDIRRAILRLPDRIRTALVLYYFGDMKTATVARLMNCPEGTVRSYLSIARRRLGELLGLKENDDE